MKNSCELRPKGKDGKPSQLYDSLLKYLGERPVANYIYAAYTTSVAAQMDSMGYTRNAQGEHKAADVEKVLNVDAVKREIGAEGVGVSRIARMEGVADSEGTSVNFKNSKEALDKAKKINDSYNGVVATVYSVGDSFNVVVDIRSSKTHMRANQVDKNLKLWEVFKQAMASIGIDLDTTELSPVVFSAISVPEALKWMHNVQNTDNKYLSRNEIKDLLTISEDTPQVKRLKQIFGSLDEVSQKIYDAYRGQEVTLDQMTLIDAALNNSKKFKGLDLKALDRQLNTIDQSFGSTKEAKIADTLEELNKEYNIDSNEIVLIGKNIRSLSRVAAEAAVTLQRQLRQLLSKGGVTEESKRVESTLSILTKEISSNKYYAGILGFLEEASAQIKNIENMLLNTPQSGDALQRVSSISNTLMRIKAITEGYYNILESLSHIDQLIIDEKMNAADINNIKEQAAKLLEFFDRYKNVIEDLKVDTMTTIATQYLGDRLPNGVAVANIVSMASADSSIYDWFYSMGRASNPLVATMGNIIRDAQDARDRKMNNIALRIRRATNALKKAGSDSSFMYEDSGYIISDIDWIAFNKAKAAQRILLKKKGLKGLSLREALQSWEDANTEDRVVDTVSGRTERVPDASYRKEFPQLTEAQQKYYTEMMQIKGELGTLLPSYAQRQYIPPQIRRSFLDAVNAAIKKGSMKDVVKAVRNWFKDLTTIREDDTRYAQNGMIDGEEFGVYAGAMDNTPFRHIPIFYIKKLEDPNELLKDFSSAVQHLASTAINYEAMNAIKDTIEFMGDYIIDQGVDAEAPRYKYKVYDMIEDNGVRILKRLKRYAGNTNTAMLINGWIDKHIYGVQLKNTGKYHVLWRNLLAYTSLKSLAVNVKGMISNEAVGELQMLIEAGGGEFYNMKDLIWAHAKVLGDNTKDAGGKMMDLITNDKNSKAALLAEVFDPLMENYEKQSHTRYYDSIIRHLTSVDLSFIGYGVGENIIHFINMYAVLHATKVYVDGKKTSLYDLYSVGNKVNGNSELIRKDATYINAEGKEVPVDDAFIEKIRKRLRYVNQTTHGSMNAEDKGLIHQYMAGRFVMNLRQWMVEHYSRRYRGSHWDATLEEYREGFYYTTSKFMYALVGDIFRFQRESMLHWKDMNSMQKANVRRAMSELAVLASLLMLEFALGEPDEHKKDLWMRMWIYQTKRAIIDVNGSTPWGIPQEGMTLLNSPMAATNVINAFLYPFTGWKDIGEEIQTGKHAGEDKYLRNIKKYLIPFYGQIEQLGDMDEDDSVFKVFEKNNLQR